MRMFAATTVLTSGLLLTGCMSPERRNSRERDDRRPPANNAKDDSPWWLEGSASKTKARISDTVAKTDRETIIAGEVVEGPDRKRLPGRTYIVVKPAEEVASANPKKGDVGVETDEDGYFFMSGLIAGKTYILSAVREYDGKKIAAEVMIKPPAGNIRLELNDNKISSLTPPPPPAAGMGPYGPAGDAAAVKPPQPANSGDRGWEPGASPAGGNRLGFVRPENVAAGFNSINPPTANIRPAPAPAAGRPIVSEQPASRLPANRVPNFLLTDMTGSDWEFRYASGRLVLLDFWSTTCGPCKRAIPSMKRLQANYGGSGLEVVAVACEQDGPFNQRARPVEEISRAKEVNYKVYLERDRHVGEVQNLFNIQFVPTLILLDRQGNILWRGGGTDTDFARAEDIIKTYLTRRD
jgi:thiol-disulfide isomerase/thioredoxin